MPDDDPTIDDNDRLFHRIGPDQVSKDASSGRYRPSSGAFRSTTNIVSVNLASLTSAESVLAKYPTQFLAEATAREVRSLGCKIVRDPEPPDNLSHALVYGNAPDGGLTKAQARGIAKCCRWVLPEGGPT